MQAGVESRRGNIMYAHTRTGTHTYTHAHTYTHTHLGTVEIDCGSQQITPKNNKARNIQTRGSTPPAVSSSISIERHILYGSSSKSFSKETQPIWGAYPFSLMNSWTGALIFPVFSACIHLQTFTCPAPLHTYTAKCATLPAPLRNFIYIL